MKDLSKIINWSELSRHITGGDRGSIRSNKIPIKYLKTLWYFFNSELPEWWDNKGKDAGIL